MNAFLKVLKVKSVFSVYAPLVFKFFGALLWIKYKLNFLLASMKTQILKIHTETSSKRLLRHSGSRLSSHDIVPLKATILFQRTGTRVLTRTT